VVKRRASLLVAAVVTLPVVACQLLAGIEERYVPDAGPDALLADATRDAGRDAAPDAPGRRDAADAGSDQGTGCVGVVPPSAPSSSTPTGQNISFDTAIRMLWYSTDGGVGLGYNLDHDCTCEGTPLGPPSCANALSHNCDADGGRDIEGNVLLSQVDDLLKGRSVADTIDSKIESGQFTIILRVLSYNVGSDDQDVPVAAFVSGGLQVSDGGSQTPLWNGTDVWTVDPRTVSSSMRAEDGGWEYVPTYVAKAYVTNKILVANLGTVSLGVGPGSVTVSNALIVATIESDFVSGGHMLTGQMAGRVATSTIFSLAATFADPMIDGGFLCGSDPTFQTLKNYVCASTDIMAAPAEDNTGQDCNAISVSFGFTAQPIIVGGPQKGLEPTVGCDGSVAACVGGDP
jgi:hypothetical protein